MVDLKTILYLCNQTKPLKYSLPMKKLLLTLVVATAVSTTAFAQNRVKNVYASASKLDVEMLQSNQPIQLNRYFFAGYNTLCLPMSVSAEQLGDIKVERFAGIQQEGNIVKLLFVECTNEGIQAGVPYLIYSPKSQYLRIKNSDAIAIDSQLKAVCMSDNKGNVVTFGSGWETIGKEGRYGIPAKQDVTPLEAVLMKTTTEQKFLPTRCGFIWNKQNSSAEELNIVHLAQSDVTAIQSVNIQKADDGIYYNLQGQKMSKDAKGLRIQNGKKTIVK